MPEENESVETVQCCGLTTTNISANIRVSVYSTKLEKHYWPLFDRPICPSLGALWPNLRWGDSGLKQSLLNSTRKCCIWHTESRGLGWSCPEGGRSSGISVVSNIPAAGVSSRFPAVTVSASPLLINASSAPVCSFSSFSLPPQQYSIQKCSGRRNGRREDVTVIFSLYVGRCISLLSVSSLS